MSPCLLILKAQMILQPLHIFLRQRQPFQQLPGSVTSVTFLVRHIIDQRVFLDLSFRVVQKDTEVAPAGVVIGIRDVRKARADFIDEIHILQGVGDHDHPLCQVALIERSAVPRKDHGRKLDLPLFHAVRKIFEDSVMQPCLFLTVKNLTDFQREEFQLLIKCAVDQLIIFIANAVPDDSVHRVMVCGHKGCRHLLVVRVGLDHFICSFFALRRVLHKAIVVGNRQPLVFRPRLHDLEHAVNCVLRFIKAERPKPSDDLNAVVGPGHVHGLRPVIDCLVYVIEKLCGDPVHRVKIAYTRPRRNRPLHR